MSIVDNLFNVLKELRERIKKYKEDLAKSEALTRYVLIDPLLRALEWNTEDPERVRPEEKQAGGQPDYILCIKDKELVKLIAVEAKSLGTKLDEKKTLDLSFNYSWKSGIPYFIITDGNIWTVYDVREPGGKQLFTVNILGEELGEVARKLLSLWYPLVAQGKIEPVKSLKPVSVKVAPLKPSAPGIPPAELSLDVARKLINSLSQSGKALLEVAFKAWKEGRALTKSEIIEELKKKGISTDRVGFTGIKSGITRQAEKLNLPPPLPSQKELGKEYQREENRYRLREEWGKVLEKILVEPGG